MTQADGNKIRDVFLFDLTFGKDFKGFASPVDAIAYGQRCNQQRKQELGLDISPLQGKIARKIHWDEQTLVLEFENNLFLEISTRNPERMDVIIKDTASVNATDTSISYNIKYENYGPFSWKPNEIAQEYSGKIFENIYLGERHVYLYFKYTHLLIFCTMHKNIENGNLFLMWDKSE